MAVVSNRFTAQRRYQRFYFDTRVRVTTAAPANKPFVGRTLEISACGASALIPGDIRIGEVVELQFILNTVDMRLRAVVRSRFGARYGFEFLTLSAQQRGHIEGATQNLEVFDEN